MDEHECCLHGDYSLEGREETMRKEKQVVISRVRAKRQGTETGTGACYEGGAGKGSLGSGIRMTRAEEGPGLQATSASDSDHLESYCLEGTTMRLEPGSPGSHPLPHWSWLGTEGSRSACCLRLRLGFESQLHCLLAFSFPVQQPGNFPGRDLGQSWGPPHGFSFS